MNKKRKKDYKTWWMIGAAFVALVIVVAAILGLSQNENIDSSYFHDDEGKIVLTMDRESAALDDSEYEPYITHVVYYYNGDAITGVRAFYEYATKAEAREVFDNLDLGEFLDSKKLNGRFVIFQVKKTQYEDLTVEELRENVELLKQIDALILDYGDGYIDNYGELNLGMDDGESGADADDIEDTDDGESD